MRCHGTYMGPREERVLESLTKKQKKLWQTFATLRGCLAISIGFFGGFLAFGALIGISQNAIHAARSAPGDVFPLISYEVQWPVLLSFIFGCFATFFVIAGSIFVGFSRLGARYNQLIARTENARTADYEEVWGKGAAAKLHLRVIIFIILPLYVSNLVDADRYTRITDKGISTKGLFSRTEQPYSWKSIARVEFVIKHFSGRKRTRPRTYYACRVTFDNGTDLDMPADYQRARAIAAYISRRSGKPIDETSEKGHY